MTHTANPFSGGLEIEALLERLERQGRGLVADAPAIQCGASLLHCGGGQLFQKRAKLTQSLTHFHSFKN